MDADAHADRTRRERLRAFRGRLERARRGGEGDEEGVSLRIDLDTAVAREASRRTRRCSASARA